MYIDFLQKTFMNVGLGGSPRQRAPRMHRSRPIRTRAILFLWAFLLVYLPAGPSSLADSRTHEFSELIANGGFIVTGGTATLAESQSDVSFIPASTIKIATGLLALNQLGPEFRFRTEFYLRPGLILVIKGYGDPFLVSEEIPAIAQALKASGLTTIRHLILDQSYFAGISLPDGSENTTNPYDAPNTALAVNFNAVPIIKHDTGRIESGEPQTPLLPIMQDIGAQLEPGRHRVNVNGFPAESGSTNGDRYTAELFTSMFQAAGIDTTTAFTSGAVQARDKLIYTYYSKKTLSDLIRSSLKHSNNFMTNQLFLASGAQLFGPPADWHKARRAMAALLQECCSIEATQMSVFEGSGLSRQNHSTPGAMLRLLRAFQPYADLLPDKDGVLLKSGSLQNVHNYVGYFPGTGSYDPFVIFLNQPENTRQDVLHQLQQIHRTSLPDRPGSATP